MSASGKLIEFISYNKFDPELSVTSRFISSKGLAIFRGLTAIYSWIILITELVQEIQANDVKYFLVYFTHLSYIGLVAYFTTAFYHSFRYIRTNKPHIPISFYKQPQILNWLFWLLYHTLMQYHIISFATYWAFLAHPFINDKTNTALTWWTNLSFHGIDIVFIFFELFLNCQILLWKFFILCLIIQLLYVLEIYINFAINDFWVYSFLDWSHGLETLYWYVGLIVASAVAFIIAWLLHKIRDVLVVKNCEHLIEQGDLEFSDGMA